MTDPRQPSDGLDLPTIMKSTNNKNKDTIGTSLSPRSKRVRMMEQANDPSGRRLPPTDSPGIRPVAFAIVAQGRHLRHKELSQKRLLSSSPTQFFTSSLGSGDDEEKPTEATSLLTSSAEEQDIIKSEQEEETLWEVLVDICFGRYVSWLLVFAPFAAMSHYWHWSPAVIFWLNFLTMIPLASILGDFTEEVAAHTNEVIGGLVNASFGNAVEVVVAIQALLANEIRVVQASMIGSIFSNLLLVLGTCFFCGGLVYKEQTFNTTAATANMALLALSGIALVLPTPFAQYYEIQDERVLVISRVAAIFLMFMYLQLLYFQLKTHVHLFEGDEGDELEVARIPFVASMVGLLLVTVLVAIFSEFLVASIDGFVAHSNISRTFIGLIVIPIVGNAVEHLTAVSVAMKNKMDLAMGVAVGSCVQIALFVVPLTVLVGWATQRNMTLNFPHFEVIVLILSVLTVQIILSNPKVNWLEGSLLITTYLMIAVGFWYEKVVDFEDYGGGEL